MSRRSARSLMLAISAATLLMLGAQAPAAAQALEPEPFPSSGTGVTQSPGLSLPLEGITWRLTEYRRRGELQAAVPDVAAWMTLRGGRLDGSGGCDRIGGSYGRVGDALAVRIRDGEGGECRGREQTRIERAMIAGLEAAASFELVGTAEPLGLGALPDTQLVIHDELGMEVLRFDLDDAATLEGGEWLLVGYTLWGQRHAAVTEPPGVLGFRSDERDSVQRRSGGDVIGSTGCNGLVGTYDRSADVLDVADIELSDAPCPEDLARQESAVIAVLRAGSTILDMPPDRLVLTAPESGDRLELVAASPLEGSTWLLTGLAGLDRSASVFPDVTMRLEGGILQGEGPCGAYGGRYATNGVVLHVHDLAGSTEPCEAERQQTALLGALRRSVLIERPRGRLRLHDAAGRMVARFDSPGGP